MHNGMDSLNHSSRMLALEYVTSHIDTCSTIVDGIVAKRQRLLFGQLFAGGKKLPEQEAATFSKPSQ